MYDHPDQDEGLAAGIYDGEQEQEQSFASSTNAPEFPEDMWSDLKKVLVEVGRTLSPEDELTDVSAAEAAVQAKDVERARVQTELKAEVTQLSRALKAAEQSAKRPNTVPSAAEHDAHVRSLEGQRGAAGKALNEGRGAIARHEADLARWGARRDEVRGLVVGEEVEEGFNAKAIRLNLLDGCGFRLLSTDGPTKLVVRNEAKNDVHAVTLDKTRSKVYWANYSWSLAGE